MKKTIIIKPTHELVEKTQRNTLRSNVIGVVGEKNSTILEFVKPSDINGDNIENYTMRAVLNNKFGSYLVDITGTELVIGPDLTTDTELTLAVQFLKDDKVKWESFPLKFTLFPTLDFGKNIFTELVEAASKLFGEDLTGVTISDIVKRIAAAKLLNAGEVTVDKTYANDVAIGPPDGKNAISQVNIKGLSPRSIEISSNGFYGTEINVDPDVEAEYWTQIYVNVRSTRLVPTNFAVEPALEAKTYTYLDTNQITTGDQFNCIGELTVKAVTAAIDSNIKPENIVDGVTILGVAGSAVVGDAEELTYLLSGLENIFKQEAVV
jgi:hypothetical protein|nr:MAG TPA: hypothetical protein [Caudoviricetes sp.]